MPVLLVIFALAMVVTYTIGTLYIVPLAPIAITFIVWRALIFILIAELLLALIAALSMKKFSSLNGPLSTGLLVVPVIYLILSICLLPAAFLGVGMTSIMTANLLGVFFVIAITLSIIFVLNKNNSSREQLRTGRQYLTDLASELNDLIFELGQTDRDTHQSDIASLQKIIAKIRHATESTPASKDIDRQIFQIVNKLKDPAPSNQTEATSLQPNLSLLEHTIEKREQIIKNNR